MSAIQMVCPACHGRYVAGVVGSTPWPAHECPVVAERDALLVDRNRYRDEAKALNEDVTALLSEVEQLRGRVT